MCYLVTCIYGKQEEEGGCCNFLDNLVAQLHMPMSLYLHLFNRINFVYITFHVHVIFIISVW